MKHGNARRLLTTLLDGTVPPRLEVEVRRHAEGCPRCQRALAELVAVEQLLARLPAPMVPAEPTPISEGRLAQLSRWAPAPAAPWGERVGLPALGACAAAALVAMLLLGPALPPVEEPQGHAVTLAAVLPEAKLLPTGLR